jgi:hypothetical protein
MSRYKVEKEWESNNYMCVVLMTEHGHRCGYVGIGENHPLYMAEYSEHSKYLENIKETWEKREVKDTDGIIPLILWDSKTCSPEIALSVHGGITYSKEGNDYPIKFKGNIWWFGYDCAHAGDAKDLEAVKNQSLKETYTSINQYGTIRTLDYCVSQCELLATQLKAIEIMSEKKEEE